MRIASKRIGEDALFTIQMICMAVFGGGQIWKFFRSGTSASLSWYVLWLLFLAINLVLGTRAHAAKPSRSTWQALFTYRAWTMIVSMMIGVALVNGRFVWTITDSWVTGISLSGVVLSVAIAKYRGVSVWDPLVKGSYGAWLKGVPQLGLAIHGIDAVAVTTIIAGHVTVLSRLANLVISIREAGWDRNRIGSAISETSNELSWVVATIAWLV